MDRFQVNAFYLFLHHAVWQGIWTRPSWGSTCIKARGQRLTFDSVWKDETDFSSLRGWTASKQISVTVAIKAWSIFAFVFSWSLASVLFANGQKTKTFFSSFFLAYVCIFCLLNVAGKSHIWPRVILWRGYMDSMVQISVRQSFSCHWKFGLWQINCNPPPLSHKHFFPELVFSTPFV